MRDNMEFSEQYLLKKLLKQHKENKNQTINIKLTDLYRLIIHFIRLNRKYSKGEK